MPQPHLRLYTIAIATAAAASSSLCRTTCTSAAAWSAHTHPAAARPPPAAIAMLTGSASVSKLHAAGATTGDAENAQAPATENRHAVVVGGGPAGLAAAITLANEPHCFDVTVLEATVGKTAAARYDPTKAYLFNFNWRGQVKLADVGVSSSGFQSVKVPADPNEPLPAVSSFAVGSKTDDEETNYWIPRHALVQILLDVIKEHEEDRRNAATGSAGGDGDSGKFGGKGRINVVSGAEFVSLRSNRSPPSYEADLPASVFVNAKNVSSSGNNSTLSYAASLVVGADGINSKVRDCLAHGVDAFGDWADFSERKFLVKKWKSPSTGLRIKVLQIQPQFLIPAGNGTSITCKSIVTYLFKSVNNGPTNFITLGLLPLKDDTVPRPCNIITRPNHEVWTIKDGEAMRRWFAAAFPRMPFRGKGEMVSDGEWTRFAEAEGTRFPYCQYCPGLQIGSPDGTCGVALVGDSIHAYPPDIGQGVNSALGDVVALDDALRGTSGSTGNKDAESTGVTIGAALSNYERVRSPESRALVRLARFGVPYQYRQPLRIDVFRRRLWMVNFMVRFVLNKLTFGIFPAPAIIMSQEPNLSFRQVMRRADAATAALSGVVGFGVWKLIRKAISLG